MWLLVGAGFESQSSCQLLCGTLSIIFPSSAFDPVSLKCAEVEKSTLPTRAQGTEAGAGVARPVLSLLSPGTCGLVLGVCPHGATSSVCRSAEMSLRCCCETDCPRSPVAPGSVSGTQRVWPVSALGWAKVPPHFSPWDQPLPGAGPSPGPRWKLRKSGQVTGTRRACPLSACSTRSPRPRASRPLEHSHGQSRSPG